MVLKFILISLIMKRQTTLFYKVLLVGILVFVFISCQIQKATSPQIFTDERGNKYWYGDPSSVPGATSIKYGAGTCVKMEVIGPLWAIPPITERESDSLGKRNDKQ